MSLRVESLPTAAAHWLGHACPSGRFPTAAQLRLTGEVKLGRWRRFHARERIGADWFTWVARSRSGWFSGPIRSGFPLGSGTWTRYGGSSWVSHDPACDDRTRSFAWRFAAHRLIWLPGPQAAEGWFGHEDGSVDVRVRVGRDLASATVRVAEDGALRELASQHWLGHWARQHPGSAAAYPFVTRVLAEATFDGVTVPSEVVASWVGGPDGETAFYRARVTGASYTFD